MGQARRLNYCNPSSQSFTQSPSRDRKPGYLVAALLSWAIALLLQAGCVSQSAPLPVPLSRSPPSTMTFSPFGFYYVDDDLALEPAAYRAGQLDAIGAIAAAGFNTIHLPIYGELDHFQTVLDSAEAEGLKVIADYQSNLPRAQVVSQFKDAPALLSWNIGDDVNVEFEPSALASIDAAVQAIDLETPTYISMFDPDPRAIEPYLATADWIGMQSYPIGDRSLDATFSEISAAVETAQRWGNKPVIANLQAFEWKQTEPSSPTRIPSFEEVRNMTFQAYAAGAQGALYYTYRDADWFLPGQTSLWESMAHLVPEVEAIEPWILQGERSAISLDHHLLKATWELGDQQLLMVISTGYEAQTIEFEQISPQLGSGTASMQSLLGGKPENLSLNADGWVVGSLNPLDVQLYQIQL
ncbi:MAG: hypothetical protein HC824_06665 [Synechococcales cyanobacterium RM1_1_8]|nr:hypothetical protein [Synechococcales cyanobacterium RM1_1_8]